MSCFPLVPLAVHARPAARAGAPALASRAPLCGDAARASMLMDPTMLLPPVFPHTFSAPAAAGWAGAVHDRPDAFAAALKSFLSSNNNNLPQWSAPSLWAGLDLAQQQQAIAAQATRMAMSSAAAAAEAANLEMERERAALRLALKRARDSPDPSDSDKGESVHSNPLYDHESSPSGFKAVRSAPRQLFSHHTQAITSADRAPLAKVAKIAPGMHKEWDSPTSTQRHIECGHCGKLFTRTRNLTRHKRIHTGMKPFVCGVCGKTFNRKDNMVTHCRIHMAQPQQAGVSFE